MLSFKFRLYPTASQEQKLIETLDGCRWVYNHFITLEPMSEYDMNYALTELKEQHPWLRNYHSKMLQMVAKRVSAATRALAALRKKGIRVRGLRYRRDEEYDSFAYNQSGFVIRNGELHLSKIGRIRIVLHRQPIKVKQVIVVRKIGKWFAVVVCETLRRHFCTIKYAKPVGIDIGITKFAHDSDNSVIENPQFLTQMLKPVRRAHRALSRKQRGSSNHKKAKHMLARLYERIHNKRRDFLHKISTEYCTRYDLIFLEELKVLNMARNHKLARRILDASWSTFKAMCRYKANRVVGVEAAYSSVDCSRCSQPVPKSLAVRTHSCPNCGAVLDRDYNSALNHLQNGMKLLQLPVGRREVTPVEIAQRSLKQEAHVFMREFTSEMTRE